jgi:hypothetical protein
MVTDLISMGATLAFDAVLMTWLLLHAGRRRRELWRGAERLAVRRAALAKAKA